MNDYISIFLLTRHLVTVVADCSESSNDKNIVYILSVTSGIQGAWSAALLGIP